MPDPNFATVSSSEVAALFDKHQYFTKWMLWQAAIVGLLRILLPEQEARLSQEQLNRLLTLAEGVNVAR